MSVMFDICFPILILMVGDNEFSFWKLSHSLSGTSLSVFSYPKSVNHDMYERTFLFDSSNQSHSSLLNTGLILVSVVLIFSFSF